MAIKGPKPLQRTIGWFRKLKDHPRQRDTQRHANSAVKKHLSSIFPPQAVVSVVLYLKVLYKLDGHTRDLLWHDQRLEAPAKLTVLQYECSDFHDFNRLYLAHNNKNAAETSRDLAYGRIREIGVKEIHTVLATQAANVARMLFKARTGLHQSFLNDIHIEAISDWLSQIQHFNAKAKAEQRHKIHSAFTVAEFITHRLHGAKKSDKFWDLFHARGGERKGGKSDSVQALQEVYDRRRRSGISRKGSRGAPNTMDLTALALRYFEAYFQGKWHRSPSSVVRDKKAVHQIMQMNFGRFVIPDMDKNPPRAVKGAKLITNLPWVKKNTKKK